MSDKKSKIAFLFNSRNNYNLFEDIFFKGITPGTKILKEKPRVGHRVKIRSGQFEGSIGKVVDLKGDEMQIQFDKRLAWVTDHKVIILPPTVLDLETMDEVDYSNHYIFNIDLDSQKEGQKELAQKMFEKYDIIDIPPEYEDEGAHKDAHCASYTMNTCINYIEKNNLDVEWIIWFSHDCHLMGHDFLKRLEDYIARHHEFESEVGIIGFRDYNTIKPGYPVCGRGILIDGIREPRDHDGVIYGNYSNLPKEYLESEYFIVEAPQDNGAMFNVKLWKRYIVPDNKFGLFNWMDDIAAQFGLKGIPAITIPSLEIADFFRWKPKFNVPRSISSNREFHRDSYGSAQNQIQHWYEKFGYHRLPGRMDPAKSKELLENDFDVAHEELDDSIQKKILGWHIDDGPKTLEDIKGQE